MKGKRPLDWKIFGRNVDFFIAVGEIGIAALTAGSPISHLCAK